MRQMRMALVVVLVVSGCGPGPVGPQGVVGPAGPSGVAFKSELHCVDAKTLPVLSLYYDLTRFSDGSVWASCEVANAAIGAQDNYFHAAGTKSATDGYCTVGFDSDGAASFGSWTFVVSGSAATATYHDKSAPSDGYVLTLGCEK